MCFFLLFSHRFCYRSRLVYPDSWSTRVFIFDRGWLSDDRWTFVGRTPIRGLPGFLFLTVDGCRTTGGRSSDGRRSGPCRQRRPCRQRGEKKTRGLRGAAAPWLNSSRGGVWGGFSPPAKNWRVRGAAPPSQSRKNLKIFPNNSK